ncbi:MAG: hypothetical protein P8Y54_06730 [Xanthomonadales bacterium]
MSMAARTTAAPAARQPTKLLADLFRQVAPGKRLVVLEIGTALPETVDFFADYRCRLHFVDLYNEKFLREDRDTLDDDALRDAFEERLSFREGSRIDLCLLWDFLTFLDDRALRAFNEALKPWLHPGTRAHGFGVHHLAIRLENVQFGIVDTETLSVRPRASEPMTYHPHSQIEMADLFDGFAFERGLLLPNGKLEMLLRSRNKAGSGAER